MISIIVPVYNVAEYLPRALDSIMAQTYADWEAILVDDGSTDASGVILDEYAKKDLRFKVIHQKNGGVSAARNIGLDNASGEYVAWVDPDDVAHPDMLEKLIQGIEHANSGNNSGNNSSKIICVSNVPENLQQLYLSALLREDGIHSYLWDKLFSRNIFEDKSKRFPQGLRYEDVRLMPELFLEADVVVGIPDKLYEYTIRDDSITGATRLKASEEFFVALRERCEKLGGTQFYIDARYGLYRHLRRMVYELLCAKEENGQKKRQQVNESVSTSDLSEKLILEAKTIYKEIKPTLRGKEKLISGLFNFSPRLYKLIRRVLP